MDFDFIQKVIPLYVEAAVLTLKLVFCGWAYLRADKISENSGS